MLKRSIQCLLAAVAVLITACNNEAAKNLEAGKAFLAENKAKSGVKTTDSGLQYKVLSEGKGELNKPGRIVRLNYTLKGIDGTVFDEGKGAMINPDGQRPGIKETLYLMKEGSKFEAVIPIDLAYGSTGYDNIPPNQVLIYEVEVLKNLQAAFLVENAKKEGVKVTKSGLQYKVIKSGSGKSPKADDEVKCHYRGTLIDGREFDSSYKRGEPATFAVGQVIKGWTEALQLMKEGDEWELFIPAEIAYGEQAPPSIGPGKTLIFSIKLLEVLEKEKPEDKEDPAKEDEEKKDK